MSTRPRRAVSRYRVLVIAEAANPEWVSVPLVGWSIASALRGVADVHLVTQVRNRDAIERAGLREGPDFTAIDNERLMKPLWSLASLLRGNAGKGWTVVTAIQSLSYPLFERMVWKRFGSRIRAGEFDVVHRVTPLSPTAPSLLAHHCSRAGIPFVLGPLNGGIPWPKGFNKERQREHEWLSYIRSVYKWMPAIRQTWRYASVIITGSLHTRSEIPRAARSKTVFVPENAVDPNHFAAASRDVKSDGLELCFIGRLVPYKGADIAMEAAQHLLRNGQARLTIIGDGPMMASLRQRANRLQVEHAVEFTGWLDHRSVSVAAHRCSMFLFPSVREFGGGAVVEAMAAGLVPIVVNYGGPGEIVTDDTGFRLPLTSRQLLISNAAALLAELASGKHDIAQLADNAVRRVQSLYTWKKKASQLLEIYDWATGARTERPRFDFLEPSLDTSSLTGRPR